jgi:hypothetical protein
MARLPVMAGRVSNLSGDTNDGVTGAVVVNEDISPRMTAERGLNDS